MAEAEAANQKAQAQQQAAISAANWTSKGGAGGSGGSKSSLRDIMEHEATVDTTVVSADGSQRMMPGTWAAKIASPSAWTLNSTSAPVSNSPAPTMSAPASTVPAPPTLSVPKTVPPAAGPAVGNAPKMTPLAGLTGKDGDDFGGKGMSATMHDWCVSSMRRLNGSDDITLLQFCMGVDSAVEIREYFSAYLGSTPQVCILSPICKFEA
jgi:PERQ amino acid-rich with GYF domain-containing protein